MPASGQFANNGMPAMSSRSIAACGVVALATTLAASGPSLAQAPAKVVNVHTSRERPLIEPLLKVFEGLAQVKVEAVYLTGDGSERLKADAGQGKVDLFIASEFSQLVAAKRDGLTASAGAAEFIEHVPEALRDVDGHWFGLTRRLRVIAAGRSVGQVKAKSYEDLVDPRWKGKVCVRSGGHPYNVMLLASIVAHKGEDAAESWLRGLKANLAEPPTGGDRDQVVRVHAGKCALALVNTYYVGGMRAATDKPESKAAADAVDIVFPNSQDRGVHVSISGMALMKGAPNVNDAVLLMDFMTSEPAQFIYAHDNHEYPVRQGVKLSPQVAGWGEPKLDDVPLSALAALQEKAARIVAKVGFDKGPGG